VFRRIHHQLEQFHGRVSFHLCYVPSRANPADGPSCGVYPPTRLLLPPIVLPSNVSRFLVDADLSIDHTTTIPRVPRSRSDAVVDKTQEWDWGRELTKCSDSWRE
jgi:hypothetical protein